MSRNTGTRPSASLSAAERVARNRRIAEARGTGEQWKAIAEREGLSVKQARRCRDEHFASAASVPEVLPIEVGALVERAVRAQVTALDRLEALARQADNSSAMVGAAKGLSAVGVTLVGLLTRLGRIGDAAQLRRDAELAVLVRAFLDFASDHGLAEEDVVDSFLGRRIEGMGLIGAVARPDEEVVG